MAKDDATKILEASVSRLGAMAQLLRLADTADARAAGGIGIRAQPGDHVFFWGKHGGVVEVKESRDPVAFPLKNVRDSQWRACKRAVIGKQNYVFFVYQHMACCYLVPGGWMLNYKQLGARASVPWPIMARWKLEWSMTNLEVHLMPLACMWTGAELPLRKEESLGLG